MTVAPPVSHSAAIMFQAEAGVMRTKRQLNTTLGDLIAAVTDEVMPIAGSEANADALVSYILNDMLIAKRVRLRKRISLRSF